MAVDSTNLFQIEPQTTFESLFLTAQQIAELLGVTTPAVYSAVKKNRFPCAQVVIPRVGLHLWLRSVADPAINEWIKRRTHYGPTSHIGRRCVK